MTTEIRNMNTTEITAAQAAKQYRLRYKAKGWRDLKCLVPPDIYRKIMTYKNQLMDEYWDNEYIKHLTTQ